MLVNQHCDWESQLLAVLETVVVYSGDKEAVNKGGWAQRCPDKSVVKVLSFEKECSDRSGPELPH